MCVVHFIISTTCVVHLISSTTCVVGLLISTTCVVGLLISTTCVVDCPRTLIFLLLMKKVKSDWRASLQEGGLNDNLRVALLTPHIESFEAMPAI